MVSAAPFQFGKSKVTIDVEGCVDCGTRWSSGWFNAETLGVAVGGKTDTITLFRCKDCQDKLTKAQTGQGWAQAQL